MQFIFIKAKLNCQHPLLKKQFLLSILKTAVLINIFVETIIFFLRINSKGFVALKMYLLLL